MARLRIRWSRSLIGYERDQRRTIRALGLRRLHQTVEREDTPTIRGMLHKVRHLVTVEQAEGG
ncbi:MAG: 50S ribosomal protein L30 [Chloroflexota bacterium]|nr:50S ribosomal protein L30 [Chloroflexota bacterium]